MGRGRRGRRVGRLLVVRRLAGQGASDARRHPDKHETQDGHVGTEDANAHLNGRPQAHAVKGPGEVVIGSKRDEGLEAQYGCNGDAGVAKC